jgi:hypothetical protein
VEGGAPNPFPRGRSFLSTAHVHLINIISIIVYCPMLGSISGTCKSGEERPEGEVCHGESCSSSHPFDTGRPQVFVS